MGAGGLNDFFHHISTIWYYCSIEQVFSGGLVTISTVVTFIWGSMVFYGGGGCDGIFPRAIIRLMAVFLLSGYMFQCLQYFKLCY